MNLLITEIYKSYSSQLPRMWMVYPVCRDHSGYGLSQSEEALFCNAFSHWLSPKFVYSHYYDVIMGTMASQITSLTTDYSTVYSGADQRKHQSSASLAFVWGVHRWPVNYPHKWSVTRKMFPFDGVIMAIWSVVMTHVKRYGGIITLVLTQWPLRDAAEI